MIFINLISSRSSTLEGNKRMRNHVSDFSFVIGREFVRLFIKVKVLFVNKNHIILIVKIFIYLSKLNIDYSLKYNHMDT